MVRPRARPRLRQSSASIRLDAYLISALRLIHGYAELDDHLVANFPCVHHSSHAWRATYDPLTILLGKRLSDLLAICGEPCRRYRYDEAYGEAPGEVVARSGDGDHVIPLAVLIEYLLKNAEGFGTPGDLKRFLGDHLVMAHIPKNLERKLLPHSMPTQFAETWCKPVGPGWTQEQKWAAMWGRYSDFVPPPGPESVSAPWVISVNGGRSE
jgi:hypothetical protein